MQFNFATANSIHFGAGTAKTISSILPANAGPIFLVTGASPYRHKAVIDLLERNGYEIDLYSVGSEPAIETVNSGTRKARQLGTGLVVAIGGGSVIDTGKAIAALVPNHGDAIEYLEGVGKGKPLSEQPLPFMAMPTTAGTGAEVTRNSVIGVPEAQVKVSLRSTSMLPNWAIVDPELTYDLPARVAAYTGMDALVQCLEAYLAKQANPLTDGIAREGIRLAARSIRAASSNTLNREAKSDLCLASLFGGIALSNAKLGSVHGFAGPLGGMIDAPHGAICASLLVSCFQMNLEILERKHPNHASLEKMRDIAVLLTGNPEAKPNYALAWFETLHADLPLESLGKLGLTADRISEAASKAATASSMKGNPIELTQFELEEILENAL